MDELTDPIVEDFFSWIDERQRIFQRRFIEGKDEPWTDDPILQDRHFCNVYRELDRVSRWYINEYVGELDPEAALLTTTIFRIVNEPDTMEVIGAQDPTSYDGDDITNRVLEAEKNGTLETTFNSAYMITGAVGESGERKIKSYSRECWGELADNIDEYWSDHFQETDGEIVGTTTADEWTTQLTELPGVSEFIAYEIYCDMTYHDWFPYTENDYVNPGPGAERCIRWLLGRVDENEPPQEDKSGWLKSQLSSDVPISSTELIHMLCEMQDEYLPEDFPAWEGKDLTLRGIEHSMCEFDKYRRVQFKEEHNIQQRMKRHKKTEEEIGIEGEETQTTSQSSFGDF